MKTITDYAYEFLKKNGVSTFHEIWEHVSKNMESSWKLQFPRKLMKQVLEDKMGELYTLLTVDGLFIRTADKKFGLVEAFSHDEVNAMKLNIGESD